LGRRRDFVQVLVANNVDRQRGIDVLESLVLDNGTNIPCEGLSVNWRLGTRRGRSPRPDKPGLAMTDEVARDDRVGKPLLVTRSLFARLILTRKDKASRYV
jgi:hypothetical protein